MAKHGVTEYLTLLASDQATFCDLIPFLLVVVDKAGNIVWVNKAFEDTVGYTSFQICKVGLGLSRFVVMEDIIKFIRSFDDTRGEKPPFRFRSKDGGEPVCQLILWQYRRGKSFLIFAKLRNGRA